MDHPVIEASLDLSGTARCRIMSVVNVTPDSFSDGGRYSAPELAINHGRDLIAQGADIVDVGGESTRPGAQRVPADVELGRVRPVIAELSPQAVVSVDTMRASVAAAAVSAGARLINDVSGGRADPDMYRVMAQAECPVVLMHWRAHSDVMAEYADYGDVVQDVRAELLARVEVAVSAGVAPERIILDPGLGFAKKSSHNWAILAGLDRLVASGFPVLVGPSRKRFLGALLADGGEPRSLRDRDVATAACCFHAALNGAWGVRVHDARTTADALAVAQALAQVPQEG